MWYCEKSSCHSRLTDVHRIPSGNDVNAPWKEIIVAIIHPKIIILSWFTQNTQTSPVKLRWYFEECWEPNNTGPHWLSLYVQINTDWGFVPKCFRFGRESKWWQNDDIWLNWTSYLQNSVYRSKSANTACESGVDKVFWHFKWSFNTFISRND